MATTICDNLGIFLLLFNYGTGHAQVVSLG